MQRVFVLSKSKKQLTACHPARARKLLDISKTPLKDTAAISSIRFEIEKKLKGFSLPVEFATGGRTKYNRTKQDYPKDHWIDAACVGKEGADVSIAHIHPLHIKVVGRDSRQMRLSDKSGFPRTRAKSQKVVRGFKTGDFVKAVIPNGKNKKTYFGVVAARSTGSFCLRIPNSKVDGVSTKHCVLVQKSLGCTFSKLALPPPTKASGIRALEVL